MGLKLKSQVFLILFLPMSLVIILMSYFNINILENTLIQSTMQMTSSMCDQVVTGVGNIIFPDQLQERSLNPIKPSQKEAIERLLGGIEDIRNLAILGGEGEILFHFGEMDAQMASKNPMFQEAVTTHKRTSHLWAYKDSSDPGGEPTSHSGFLDSRILSYEHFVPLVKDNRVIGTLYVSFHAKKLSLRLKLIALANIILVFIFLLSIFIGLSIWCDNAIRRPLEFILKAQEKIAKGDFDIRVNLDFVQTNEFARTYNSFNRMADDLKSFREELEKKNRSLGKLNEQYRRLNERLEQEVQDKTKELREFFSLIAHDLKVPLAASQGYTELLLKAKTGPLNEKQKRFLHSISMANSHLLHLVRNMLDSVKYDAGKINYFKESFELSMLVDEVSSNLHLFLEEKEISLWVSIPADCEVVCADRMKIGQVITNLLSNAIEVSPPKKKVSLSAMEQQGIIEVSISDDGPGIPAEQQASIFNKFTQFPCESKSSSGMGLGLYIVKRILEGHLQTIRVESSQGQGTTFLFTLPKEKIEMRDSPGEEIHEERM